MIEVAIIGAGPAGISVGSCLSKAGISACIFSDERRKIGVHGTVQTIGRSAIEGLIAFGVSKQYLADLSHLPDRTVVDWQEDRDGGTDLFAALPRSLVVDQTRLERALIAIAVRNGANVQPSKAVLIGFDAVKRLWEIECQGRTLFARVVVDATGRAASVIRRNGAKLEMIDALTAWIVSSSTANLSSSLIVVKAVPDGWIFACSECNKSSLTFVGNEATCRLDPAYTSYPTSLVEACHEMGIDPGSREVTRSKSSAAVTCLDRAVVPAMLAVGDAAMALDPLCAEGIAKAIQSGERAAAAITEALQGRFGALIQYERSRRTELSEHLRSRARFYGESRYQSEPFWKSRSNLAWYPGINPKSFQFSL
ncbi:NAD(P)/FAD-dependent oxidoreductase [Rhizobium ruizarguesonis]|uniref:NAD(P)/FAD-dependent oxidoreductase n=1 Tax=Rhizobium ruizarguesonis TaxID=2081791 RepID=UPI00163AAD4C|nr:NAD(P)/FAD-dependent oxidoreductase [Rhizobium ruizarguesonis]MBC2807006.1 NAD(P)/FAD-dependent oxidoreductase [Rhizobium ruizarguesonis]